MATLSKNSHCSYCGSPFDLSQKWPRKCSNCGHFTYLNPVPVAVILVPVDAGLLLIRRSIEPHIGKLALPGGYVGLGESWQEAGVREVEEETGVTLTSTEIKDFGVVSAPDNTILIFGITKTYTASELPPFVQTNETSERIVITTPQELAFPLHELMVQKFFKM